MLCSLSFPLFESHQIGLGNKTSALNIGYGNARDKAIYVLSYENQFFYYLSNGRFLKAWAEEIHPACIMTEWPKGKSPYLLCGPLTHADVQ